MAGIKSVEQIARKWATVTPGRVSDYQAGVESPTKDWETQTAGAEGAWEMGVQQSIADKRFAKGVRRAGTDAWKQGAVQKGTQRWGPGVAIAEDAYRTGFAPIRDAIERVNLPPRYARRDPRNLNRVKAVVDAVVEAAKKR